MFTLRARKVLINRAYMKCLHYKAYKKTDRSTHNTSLIYSAADHSAQKVDKAKVLILAACVSTVSVITWFRNKWTRATSSPGPSALLLTRRALGTRLEHESIVLKRLTQLRKRSECNFWSWKIYERSFIPKLHKKSSTCDYLLMICIKNLHHAVF